MQSKNSYYRNLFIVLVLVSSRILSGHGETLKTGIKPKRANIKTMHMLGNSYGVGKVNMKLGIMPPLSGEYNNANWKTGNGAWIRSEIWACLARGNPLLAAQFAWSDACVDHGCTDGTFAEIFAATLESAAFIEKDRDKLIQFADHSLKKMMI